MFRISVNVSPLTQKLVELGREMPARFARGINFAVFDARETVKAHAPVYINEPTPWTMRQIFATRATPSKLYARVGYASSSRSGLPPEYYMSQLATGGTRRPKKYESKLRGMGILGDGQFTVFGKTAFARFGDQYGNLPIGMYRTATSQIGRARAGKRATKLNVEKGRYQYWAAGKPGAYSGIMMRWGPGPQNYGYFLYFVNSVQYQAQYPFIDLMQREFDRTLERALYRAIVLKK